MYDGGYDVHLDWHFRYRLRQTITFTDHQLNTGRSWQNVIDWMVEQVDVFIHNDNNRVVLYAKNALGTNLTSVEHKLNYDR